MENPTPHAIPETIQKKTNRFLWSASVFIVVLIIAAGGTAAWYYAQNLCEIKAVAEASSFLVSQLNTYDAQYQFTTTVLRTELTIPVNKLEQIALDTKTVTVPACMQTAKNELLNYMGAVNSAFRAYMATEQDPTIRDLLDQSNTHFNNFQKKLNAVNKCAPFCAPWD